MTLCALGIAEECAPTASRHVVATHVVYRGEPRTGRRRAMALTSPGIRRRGLRHRQQAPYRIHRQDAAVRGRARRIRRHRLVGLRLRPKVRRSASTCRWRKNRPAGPHSRPDSKPAGLGVARRRAVATMPDCRRKLSLRRPAALGVPKAAVNPLPPDKPPATVGRHLPVRSAQRRGPVVDVSTGHRYCGAGKRRGPVAVARRT